jgi:hypothetical protein
MLHHRGEPCGCPAAIAPHQDGVPGWGQAKRIEERERIGMLAALYKSVCKESCLMPTLASDGYSHAHSVCIRVVS